MPNSSPKPNSSDPAWTIGALAKRSGLSVSALRFYAQEGLLPSVRSEGGHRMFARSSLRRVAFVRAAQSVGLALPKIRQALAQLPNERTPTAADWQALAAPWLPLIDAQLTTLNRLKTQLTSCIGCGCLSIANCPLYNPNDRAAKQGAGPRYWLGDKAP